jgi:hypothetical protein
MTAPNEPQPRGRNGKFTRSMVVAKRDADAAALRVKGWTLQRIANELGYGTPADVHNGIKRAYRDVPTEDIAEAKRLDIERIDRLIAIAWDILEAEHLAISNGRVVARCVGIDRDEFGEPVRDENGKPVKIWQDVMDDGPSLAAIDRIKSLMERRARMVGYDEPVKTRAEVITQDVIDSEIVKLERLLADGHADHPGDARESSAAS